MNALLQRLLAPVLGAALVLALLAAAVQWRSALKAEKRAADVTSTFASYREAAERNHAAALRREAESRARGDKVRQEALDAEHLARLAAQADADRLRAGNGRLQRLAADLSTSLGDRAHDAAASAGCPAAQARIDRLAFVVGALDDFAAGAAAAADDARIRGQLCERSYEALTK